MLPFARSENSYGIIFHEYAHYLIHRNVRSFVPIWVDEGFAEFYSTFQPDYKGQSLLGRAPGPRVQSLRVGTFMPLSEVVSPREMEKTWRTGNRIQMFYAEAWALVHYLIVGRKDTPASFGTYLGALAKASSQDEAFKEAFGVDIASMQRELLPYVARFAFPALMLPRVADTSTRATTAPIQEADVRQLEGSLLAHVGATDEAEKALQAALSLNPDHIDTRVALAAVRLTQGRSDEAIASLSEVTRAAPTHLAAQYYLGVALAQSWRHLEAVAASIDRSS